MPRVHKLTLVVLDFEDIPADEIRYLIENNRHAPNIILAHEMSDIEDWDDDHPLNQKITLKELNKWLMKNGSKNLLDVKND